MKSVLDYENGERVRIVTEKAVRSLIDDGLAPGLVIGVAEGRIEDPETAMRLKAASVNIDGLEKRCRRCGIVKPYRMYSLNRAESDGLNRICKECLNTNIKL